jgi:methylenetetrahydrofolate--tRNA-(uracil-5-)-methyltransferase
MGLLAGRFAAAEALGVTVAPPPPTTSHGALLNHITGGHIPGREPGTRTFQPMNANFGLFPEPSERNAKGRPLKGRDRRAAYCRRGIADFAAWLGGGGVSDAAQ